MRAALRGLLAGVVAIGGILAFGCSSATAQDPGLGGILGGYGAMTGASGASMGGGFNVVDASGMGGNVVVPAAGGSVPAMSPSMSGSALSFQPRSSTSLYSARPSSTLDSMGAGMTRMPRGMSGRRPFVLPTGTLSGGMGLGGGMRQTPAATRMGVMPPRIGYPFRQPPSLLTPSASGAGMSM
jgi:hypothetical protein